MRPRNNIACTPLLITAWMLAATWAQGKRAQQDLPTPQLASIAQNAAAPLDEIPVFTADTRLVVVHASVVDKSGKLVTNLLKPALESLKNEFEPPHKIFL